MDVDQRVKAQLFEQIITPHVPAAWNLVRWLLRDPNDAEDVLQDAYLRAFRFVGQYRGGDARSWFLTIVRNLCHDFLRSKRGMRMTIAGDEQFDQIEGDTMPPPQQLEQSANAEALHAAIEQLPIEYREVLVLREFEGLSYKEIAAVADVPMGTVMSRLARSREKLLQLLTADQAQNQGRR